jgi:hypothetical protein
MSGELFACYLERGSASHLGRGTEKYLTRIVAAKHMARELYGMKHLLAEHTTARWAFAALALLTAVYTATASPQPENLLLSVGFKAKVATTAKQKEELKTLPEKKVSPVTQNGKTFYVYPDASSNQIYVGDEAAYQIYLDRVTEAGESDASIVNTDDVRGNQIKIREIYGFGPLDDTR